MQKNTKEWINNVQENEGTSQNRAMNCSPSTFMTEKEEMDLEYRIMLLGYYKPQRLLTSVMGDWRELWELFSGDAAVSLMVTLSRLLSTWNSIALCSPHPTQALALPLLSSFGTNSHGHILDFVVTLTGSISAILLMYTPIICLSSTPV